jgi:uncharacterized protein (TIGR03000 family)
MYSVVLMMAMTGTGETPAGCHNGWGCNGYSNGCSWSGSGSWGCSNGGWGCSGYSSCYSGGKHGCNGGGLFSGGLFGGKGCNGGGLFSGGLFGGRGCNGGLFGKKSRGCNGYSSCYNGCNGYSSCHGYGGCNGYVSCSHGYSGCNGHAACHGYNGCAHGANGCAASHVAPVMPHAGHTAPMIGEGTPPIGVTPETKPEVKPEVKPDVNPSDLPKVGSNGAQATLVVTLPADATLTIDGAATSSTSAHRVFETPVLEHGRKYGYTLKAEFEHQGKTVSLTKQVVVEAGLTTTVQFDTTELNTVATN